MRNLPFFAKGDREIGAPHERVKKPFEERGRAEVKIDSKVGWSVKEGGVYSGGKSEGARPKGKRTGPNISLLAIEENSEDVTDLVMRVKGEVEWPPKNVGQRPQKAIREVERGFPWRGRGRKGERGVV